MIAIDHGAFVGWLKTRGWTMSRTNPRPSGKETLEAIWTMARMRGISPDAEGTRCSEKTEEGSGNGGSGLREGRGGGALLLKPSKDRCPCEAHARSTALALLREGAGGPFWGVPAPRRGIRINRSLFLYNRFSISTCFVSALIPMIYEVKKSCDRKLFKPFPILLQIASLPAFSLVVIRFSQTFSPLTGSYPAL
jgi:hypothetical protein